MRSRGKVGSCVLAAAIMALSGSALGQTAPSAADVQSARAAFRQGMELRAAGKTAEALPPLRTAHELAHTPITALELGRTLVTLGRVVEGTEVLLEAQRIPKAYDESPKGAAARVEAGKLAAESATKIATLRLALEGAAADAQVKIDGEVVRLAALPLGRKLDPGPHTVLAANPRAPEASATVELKPGETQDMTLRLEPTPKPPPPVVVVPPPPPPVVVAKPVAPPPPPPPEPPPSTTWRTVAIAGFGVAGVGAVVGAITGGVAMSAASDAKKACVGTQCPSDTFSRVESGRGAATVSTVAFAIGGAGLGVGVLGLLMKPAAREPGPAPRSANTVRVEPWLSVGSAGLQGTF